MNREEASRILADVPDTHVFSCCDGRKIRNVRELGKTLAHMGEDSFRYHANNRKNDFSTWIRETIGDETLAVQLSRSADKKQTLRELSHRITYLAGQLA